MEEIFIKILMFLHIIFGKAQAELAFLCQKNIIQKPNKDINIFHTTQECSSAVN